MSTNLPIKSSSRAGRFKKKLVPEEQLEREAPVIQDRMAPVLEAFEHGHISGATLTSVYVITALSLRYPAHWLGARRQLPVQSNHQLHAPLDLILPFLEPNIQHRLKEFSSLGDIFNHFALKSTPLSVNRSLLGWSTGAYGLELMFRIPAPYEVLEQQKRGRRVVTVISDAKRASRLILGERDALGFTMHDLIHADHFYFHNDCYQGQLGFYGLLNHCLKEQHFSTLMSHPEFEREFEYLIADMNAYAIHLLKCFKAALIHYHPEKEYFFSQWLDKLKLDESVKSAFLGLNTKSYDPHTQDKVILNYLESWIIK